MDSKEKQVVKYTLHGLIVTTERFTKLFSEEVEREGLTAENIRRFNDFMSVTSHLTSCYTRLAAIEEENQNKEEQAKESFLNFKEAWERQIAQQRVNIFSRQEKQDG